MSIKACVEYAQDPPDVESLIELLDPSCGDTGNCSTGIVAATCFYLLLLAWKWEPKRVIPIS
jgi:hypothetical protein